MDDSLTEYSHFCVGIDESGIDQRMN